MVEMDDNEVEGTDRFEDCELKEEIFPIFHIIVIMLNNQHPTTTAIEPRYAGQLV